MAHNSMGMQLIYLGIQTSMLHKKHMETIA